MGNQKHLTILHISDFHFTARKLREQKPVVDALVRDLRALCIGHRRPDLVCFTGDLVEAGGTDSHEIAYDLLLDQVSKATGCSDERILLAPGNHDLSWAVVEKYGDQHREWREGLNTPDELAVTNSLFEKASYEEIISEKFAAYNELARFLGPGEGARKHRNAFVTVDYIEELNLDVLTLNTAALSTGGKRGFEKDERLLIIPEYALMEAAGHLTDGAFKLVLAHHPFGMMTDASARLLEGAIAKNGQLFLFGHMHDPQPRRTVGLKGEILSDQAGAIFTARRNAYIGYSLITIDRPTLHTEILIQSYYSDRDEFDVGTNVIPDGRWWSSQEAREHFRKIAAPVDDEKFREHLKGPALTAFKVRETAQSMELAEVDRFVAPPLKRSFFRDIILDSESPVQEEPVQFEDLLQENSNVILYGKPEYGRTTLLREIRYLSLANASEIPFPRLPAFVDFSDIVSNADQLLRKLRGGAEEVPEGQDLESLLKLGHVCVLIDDVIYTDTNRMNILRQFVQRFPKARYIFSSPHATATQFGACVDPEMPLRFEFVEVQEFKRSNMRELLTKDERCTDVEEWLDRLQEDFREINLPFTAANGSILIEILSEKYNFTPINRSVLMEQFIDTTLRKVAGEQSRRATFDYTNKTDLLAHLAGWMARNDNYKPKWEAFRLEVVNYINVRGLTAPIDEILREFFTAKILLRRSDERVSFRYSGMLEYFVALLMASDPAFKAWVTEEKRYLQYVNEILYYAGRNRNDAELLNVLAERHNGLMDLAIETVGALSPEQFEKVALPNEEDDSNAADFEVLQEPLSQDEKDAELEAELPRDAEDRQEVFRPKAEDEGEKLMLSIVLYSGMIKNMELIDDAEKRKHLKEIWRAWSLLLREAVRFAPRLAKERRIRVNGALYEVHAPHGMSDATLLKRMLLYIPHVHLRALSHALGTEKLERQLAEPTLEEHTEPKIYEFLRVGLIADLRLSQTPAAVAHLATSLHENQYLLWALLVHLGELRRHDRIREEHLQKLDKPIAKSLATLKGGSAIARGIEERRQLRKLGRERLLLTMKRGKDAQ